MHIRTTSQKRNGKTYTYAQLVQSYRREDGVPAHRVIASLGNLSAQMLENLKCALQAGRQGKAVVIASEVQGLANPGFVQANLRYLDVAVMLKMWQSWGLDELFGELLDDSESLVSYSKIFSALTIQRCVAPGSKLFAKRWFPTTALPELIGLLPDQFNNTRIHRDLLRLNDVNDGLQERLPKLYQSQHGKFAWCAMDITDAHFTGHGCELAKRGHTKDGHNNQRNVGVVLLCNSDGYPLRWQPIPGNAKDHIAMGQMVDSVKSFDWLQKTPIVFDRAMGCQSTVLKLVKSGLHFLTAAHVDAIESYTTAVPYSATTSVELEGTHASYESDIQRMTEAALKADMKVVGKHLLVKDLGLVDVDLGDIEPSDGGASTEKKAKKTKILTPLRLVAYFNPRMFVDQRRRARANLAELQGFVAELNEELKNAKKSREEGPTRRKLNRQLEKRHWLDLFDVEVSGIKVGPADNPVASFHCAIKLRPEAWSMRHRYNGFVLLLGHSALSLSGEELARMYRAKDVIEKDFQAIKSQIKLRPIFHHTDPKVRAHITLCMLALLLKRTLEHKLRKARLSLTSAAALEALGTCHLNLLKLPSNDSMPYAVTQASKIQREILDALALASLVDPNTVSTAITSRASLQAHQRLSNPRTGKSDR
jgi:transposase